MGDVVNLRQVRKLKSRTERQEAAAQNRAVFGRTKAERDREQRLREKAGLALDGHRRSDAKSDGD